MSNKRKTNTVANVEVAKQAEVVNKVGNLKVEDAVSSLANTAVVIQNQLANIQSSLTASLQQLNDVNTAISVKEEELKKLYTIEVSAQTLADIEQKIEIAKSDYEQYIEETERERKRENDEYVYNLNLSRRKDQDNWAKQVATRNDDLDRRTKEIEAKEELFKNQEQMIANFPAEKANAVSLAEEAVRAKLEMEYRHQKALEDKDWVHKNASIEAELATVKAENKGLRSELEKIRADLEKSRATIESLGKQALESTSARGVVTTLEKALEQLSKKNSKD